MKSFYLLLAFGLAASSLCAQTFATPVNDIVNDREAIIAPALPHAPLRAA